MTNEELKEAIAFYRGGVRGAHHEALLIDAASSWASLVWRPGSEVTLPGRYVVPSEDVWEFDGEDWFSVNDGDSDYEDAPRWCIPWSALPPVPTEER